jgi:CrcB protein
MLIFYAAMGGAVGASLRYAITSFMTSALGVAFPYGTMLVNVFGSFLMGVLIAWLAHTMPHSNELRTFLAVGVLGGFTTFSAFSLDVLQLFDRGQMLHVAIYVLISVIVSVALLFIGMVATRAILVS